ncbi:sigma-70 family RNA polymerase sigma factor [Dactylosporangium sp. AC04546]|uniref:RNA polymerase sigma factor n=1 Tax=Dactylosporangium sp. AC04546 TaxID=2862460 RepID=UPI001EDFDD5F|nr:sigma-70 family RNA polymerase sigma factor [Dactylosporangium sp. AC04546]WVK81278.1 sigma-70 family RNA polymerase sigma factor [Dactylosporangium sp. AC04546]
MLTDRPAPEGLDHEAFRAVYAAHYVPLVRLAYVTTGSRAAAEDVVQEAFIEWYRRGAQVREPVPYLRRAVVSRCTSWVRRRRLERRHAGAAEPTWASGAAAAAGEAAGSADAQAVRAALHRLNPRQRAAVFLRFYLDLSEAQIAAALGCRPGTVKSLLHRGLAAVKEELDVD